MRFAKQTKETVRVGVLTSVVIFFEIPLSEQVSFVLPQHVIEKVDKYAFCLFQL